MTGRKEIDIPFCGFYESAADQRIDNDITQYFDKEGDGEDHTPESFYCEFNEHASIRLEYCKEYVAAFESWLSDLGIELSLEYAALSSPKEYNFTTDRIFVNAPMDQLRQLYKAVDKDVLRQTIKDRFTTRDGFISFYSNDLDQWLIEKPVAEWDANQWGTVLLAAIGDNEILEWEVMEHNYAYETVSNHIWNLCSAWEVSQALAAAGGAP